MALRKMEPGTGGLVAVFRYDQKKLDPLEADFLLQGGVLSGTVKHVGDEDKDLLVVGF